jgi:hypothetical protein
MIPKIGRRAGTARVDSLRVFLSTRLIGCLCLKLRESKRRLVNGMAILPRCDCRTPKISKALNALGQIRQGEMFKGELMLFSHMFLTAVRREANNTRPENGDDDDLVT